MVKMSSPDEGSHPPLSLSFQPSDKENVLQPSDKEYLLCICDVQFQRG